MAKWKGQSRGNKLGYQIFIWTINNLGLAPAYLILRFVALWFFFFAGEPNKHLRYYFSERLGFSKWKTLKSMYANYYIFGQTLLDKVAILAGLKEKFDYFFDGEQHLHKMAESTGGILISAHLGNWEIAGNFLNRLDAPFNIVMFDNEHEQIKEMLEKVMVDKNLKVILIKEDLSHIFEINAAIKNKELLCFHGDRFVEGSKYAQQAFLGKEAAFPLGPFALATKYKMPYSFVYAMKEGKYYYHFTATPGKIHEGNPEELQKKYVALLEQQVQKYPLQWFNYYDFWDAKEHNNS